MSLCPTIKDVIHASEQVASSSEELTAISEQITDANHQIVLSIQEVSDIIEEQENPRQSWNALYRKYSKVKPGDLRQLEREITSFERGSQAPGKSPEDCFALLKVLRR